MDIEKLTKSQIVLLTLLVSFVTSIATGIVTVSLMDQAPPSIAQTVNRVVERTVEKMVPAGQTANAAVTMEKTVVVKESDLVVKAIESVSSSIVRFYTTSKGAEGNDVETFLGLGVVVAEDGTIATDIATLPADGSVMVAIDTGTRVLATLVESSDASGLALLQGATSTESGPIAWHAASFAADRPSLGESVFAISGKGATRIGDGIVTALPATDEKNEDAILETSVPPASIAFGSPLVSANGEIEGISTRASRAVSESSFLASLSVIMYTTKTKSTETAEE